jgi:hypothetical protein
MFVHVHVHVNNATCRVGSSTTYHNQHVGVFVHACQQHDSMMSCWVEDTCCNQHVWLYMYIHVNNTTCRVGCNTICYNQHVGIVRTCMPTIRHVVLGSQHTCYNQHVCLYMYMHIKNTTCRVGSNTVCYNQHVCGRAYPDTAYRLGRWDDQSTQDLPTWSMIRPEARWDGYLLGHWCDPSTWSLAIFCPCFLVVLLLHFDSCMAM